ncbi:ELWxxDGT repeat protein [Bacterioplanoides sp.]|uniref:ELWxxDGT repeat protein n=1 Tax=Bacterioplanoides sp. TaxID=2066072 RepID=UPI003B59AFB3
MQNKLTLSSLLLTSTLLAACGGGGGGSSSPDTTNNPSVGDNTNPSTGDNPPPTNEVPATAFSGLLFSATGDINQGAELWASDGTEAGTRLIKDLNEAGSSNPHNFVKAGNVHFFVASNNVNGKELWKTDGTAAGTTLVKDIHPSGDANPALLTALGSKLIFVASDDTDRAIWVSDGTADGTVRVTNGSTGVKPGVPSEMVAFNNKVYFAAGAEGTIQSELWSTDGTTAGTQLHRVNPNRMPSDGLPAGIVTPYIGASIRQMVANDNSLFFIGNNGAVNANFAALRIDTNNNVQRLGSDSGINELELVSFASDNAGVAYSYNFGGGDIAGFYAKNNFARRAVTTFGQGVSRPTNLTAIGDKLLFAVDADNGGEELWITSGFFNGTTRVKDIRTGNADSDIRDMVALGNKAIFVAKDGAPGGMQVGEQRAGEQLWVTDGTANNTIKINDQAANISQFKQVSGKLYFTASSATHGNELWVTDGTFAGTKMVKDISNGSNSSNPLLVGAPQVVVAIEER